MKEIISVIIVGFLIINGFGVIGANLEKINSDHIESAQVNNLVYTINFPGIEELRFLNKNDYLRIELDSFSFLTEIGKPMLPVKNYLIALPPSTRADTVDFQFDKLTQIPGFYKIEPAPKIIIPDSQNINEKIDEEWKINKQKTYNSDQVYPSENGKIISTGAFKNYPYVLLSICPFQYLPKSGAIKYYNSVKITITYDISKDNDIFKSDTMFNKKASELFYNYNQIKNMYNTINPKPKMKDEYDYLIITSNDLVSTVQSSEFLNWKADLGYNIKIVLISDNEITSQPGIDLAEQIRNFLREYYMTWGVQYVLLIGDYTTVPMRYCSPNPDNLYGKVPTDIYYADLSYPDSESWNSNDDNFYGVYTQDNPDFLAEIYVGRIPTSDNTRLEYTLDKIVIFEQDTDNWKDNALHGGAMLFYANEDHDPIIDHDIDGCSVLDAIEKDIMSDWNINHYSEHEGLSPSIYNWDALTEPAFTMDWRNNQHGVVNWAAHGAPASIGRVIWSWDDGDGVPESENGELTWGRFLDTYSNLEGDYPSIVFAVSCNVGYPEPTQDGNLGIDLLTKESFGAAVAVCSATRGAAISVNWTETHAGAEALCYEFNHYMINGPNGPSKIGEALYDSKFYVHNNFGWSHYLEYQNMYDYNLYGDPTMVREGITINSPSKPDIEGPNAGKLNIEYTFTFVSTDPDGDAVMYNVDWGDGNTEWTEYGDSGVEVTLKHTWTSQGTFTIKAQAVDIHGAKSDWAEFPITIPRNKAINKSITELLQGHQNLFPLLQKLIQQIKFD
jgi:hypothetical protein